MSQSAAGAASSQRTINQLSLLLHIRKTVALAGALLSDRRIHWLPKVMFVSTIGFLLMALLGSDLVGDFLSNFIVPFLGPVVLGIPADATFDWVALAVAAFNLLKLFPSDIVGEHYDRLFRAGRHI